MKRWIGLSLASLMCTSFFACSETISTHEEEETAICKALNCAVACCNDQCVDTMSSRLHCGQCNTPCNGQCSNGKCNEICTGKVCEGKCVDTASDPQHCGACNLNCAPNMACSDRNCVCSEGFTSCDGKSSTGCETRGLYCECTAGTSIPCYSGRDGTENVGVCKAGRMTCLDGLSFDDCKGQVIPGKEIPRNGLDDNCNGKTDEDGDEDGDGWTVNQGDCCDNPIDCRVNDPAKVNPGAFDVPGNGIDDDCDGKIDNAPVRSCSTTDFTKPANQSLSQADAFTLAQAMDICQLLPSGAKGYGLIKAELLLANGSPLPATGNKNACSSAYTLISPAEQVAVIKNLGGTISPKSGSTMAVISSGKAQDNKNKGLEDCAGNSVEGPAAFLNAHGGKFPTATGCGSGPQGSKAKDSMMLRLTLRAPSNAAGFSFSFRFFSKEYPKYVCDKFNDFFLALLDSKHPDIPADRNISFDANKNPVSVNNAFFTHCKAQACTYKFANTSGLIKGCPPTIPCSDNTCGTCPGGSKDVAAYADINEAGATAWLTTSSPIMPGEVFTLDLIIFDAGEKDKEAPDATFGHIRDSLALIDHFEWRTEPTSLVTVIN